MNYDNDDMDKREDKILNNSYNTGEAEYTSFSNNIEIDDRVAGQYKEIGENIISVRSQKMLEELIYNYFEKSIFFEKYKVPKRVDKSDMIKMYYFFKEKLLLENAFSSAEIFIGFAEFFQINYDQLYTEIGVKDKEELLREIQDGANIKNKIKTKKLF